MVSHACKVGNTSSFICDIGTLLSIVAEPTYFQTVIDYSRFDEQPGDHNYTILAESTTGLDDQFLHQFHVPGELVAGYSIQP